MGATGGEDPLSPPPADGPTGGGGLYDPCWGKACGVFACFFAAGFVCGALMGGSLTFILVVGTAVEALRTQGPPPIPQAEL